VLPPVMDCRRAQVHIQVVLADKEALAALAVMMGIRVVLLQLLVVLINLKTHISIAYFKYMLL
jgi:hypothetical protein